MSTEELDDQSSSDPTHLSKTIAVVDGDGFVFWPHRFTRWAQKYKPPDHFLLTLLFLWDATVNHKMRGRIAISQIPVREHYSMKWLAAFVACGFFTVVKAGPRELKGSLYEYKPDSSPDDWEALFEWAAWIAEETSARSWDKVRPEDFGDSAARHVATRGRLLSKENVPQNVMVAFIRRFLKGAK